MFARFFRNHSKLIDQYRQEWVKDYADYGKFCRKFELDDEMMARLVDEATKA